MDEAAAYGAKRPYAREVLFDALSLLLMGKEKNLKGMSEAAVHGAKSLHIKEDNIVHMGVGRDRWYQSQGRLSSKGVGKALGAKSPISLK